MKRPHQMSDAEIADELARLLERELELEAEKVRRLISPALKDTE